MIVWVMRHLTNLLAVLAAAGFGGGGFGGGGFADIFDQMFSEFSGGAGGGRQRNSGGNDLRYDMTVSLEDDVYRPAGRYFNYRTGKL